jgi:ATP-dependent DNA ligase
LTRAFCCAFKDRDLTSLPLNERREVLRSLIAVAGDRIMISEYAGASAVQMLAAVREDYPFRLSPDGSEFPE